MTATIYHNPRCSKSRQSLALLKEHTSAFDVVEYLKTPLDRDTLAKLAQMLGMRPHEMVRVKEAAYDEAGLSAESDDGAILDAIVAQPILLERPIIVRNGKAVIGRPPENLLKLFDATA